MPLSTQAVSKSQNFLLDGIGFGTNLSLVTVINKQPPSISSEGPTVTELQPTQVTIVWKTDLESSSRVSYGTAITYGLQNGFTDLVTTHTVTLYGLTPETLYHYKVVSQTAGGETGETTDHTFTTPAENGIQSIKVTDVSYDKALVSWLTGNITNSTLEYGSTPAYGQTKKDLSGSLTTNHVIQLTDLSSGTDYHVRIDTTNAEGVVTRSSDFGFTTLANPEIQSISFVDDSPNQVSIVWKTNVPTSGVIKVNAKGEKTGQSLGTDEMLMSHQTVVKTLTGNTNYEAVITATDAQGRQVVSPVKPFATIKDNVPPVIGALKVDVQSTDASIIMSSTWQTDELSDTAAVLEAKTTGKKTTLTPQNVLTIDHVVAKSGLDPATPYTLTVMSTDAAGNIGSKSISFITPVQHKSILQLLLDSLSSAFGWTGNVMKK